MPKPNDPARRSKRPSRREPDEADSKRRSYAEGANVDQLRSDIDSGRTCDKVPVTDPAAAPLGTDDEAGGFPPDPKDVAEARRRERQRRKQRK